MNEDMIQEGDFPCVRMETLSAYSLVHGLIQGPYCVKDWFSARSNLRSLVDSPPDIADLRSDTS